MINDGSKPTSDSLSLFARRERSQLDRVADSLEGMLGNDDEAALQQIEGEGILFLADPVAALFSYSSGVGWFRCCRWIQIPGTLVITRARLRFVGRAPAPRRMIDVLFTDPAVLKVDASLNRRGRLVINVPKHVGTSFRRYWRFDRKVRIETPRVREALDVLTSALERAGQDQQRTEQQAPFDRA